MNWLGYAGVVLLLLAAAVAAFGFLALLPSALRLRRASLQTSDLVDMYRQHVSSLMLQGAELTAEREALLRPLRPVRRVLGHPLTAALFDSYRRRRRRIAARSL